jgi:phosphohistidine swiveling domain-containing protein
MSQAVADNKLFSLSEWYQNLGLSASDEFRKEDNEKRERLEVIFQEIGLLYDRPDKFPAQAVKERSTEFLRYLESNKDRLCAFRLVADDPSLPKLRIRGKTVGESLAWLDEQQIDFSKYRLDIVPHPEKTVWSAIFMVKPEGIIGEIISGGHSLLTMGNSKVMPVLFKFDYHVWQFSENNIEAQGVVKEAIGQIKVTDEKIQNRLKEKLDCRFINNYIAGYWEFTDWQNKHHYFVDYNRLLSRMLDINDFIIISSSELGLKGALGYPGRARGKVVKVTEEEISTKAFPQDSILVCECTTPEFLPLMKKASAIITDQGGILSHAAIIARELKIPCLVGTGKATQVLNDDDQIEIDSKKMIIRKLS